MKIVNKYITLFIIITSGGLVACNAQDKQDEMLLGEISKSDLQKVPYAAWYNESDQGYQVDAAAITELDKLLNGVEIKIVMGTWCHDSKREVPRFYKILSAAGINEDSTTMIALDRKKRAPNSEIDGMGITNTPTFIFYKDGKELNRIVEKPAVSLEKDITTILKGSEYRHLKLPK